MIAEYKQKSNQFILGGIGLSVLAFGAMFMLTTGSGDASSPITLGFIALRLVGYGLFITGCVYYAMAKGYSAWVGALGFLAIIGLIILAVLPDKEPEY